MGEAAQDRLVAHEDSHRRRPRNRSGSAGAHRRTGQNQRQAALAGLVQTLRSPSPAWTRRGASRSALQRLKQSLLEDRVQLGDQPYLSYGTPKTCADFAPLLDRFKESGRELTVSYDARLGGYRLKLAGPMRTAEAVVLEQDATPAGLAEALEELLVK